MLPTFSLSTSRQDPKLESHLDTPNGQERLSSWLADIMLDLRFELYDLENTSADNFDYLKQVIRFKLGFASDIAHRYLAPAQAEEILQKLSEVLMRDEVFALLGDEDTEDYSLV